MHERNLLVLPLIPGLGGAAMDHTRTVLGKAIDIRTLFVRKLATAKVGLPLNVTLFAGPLANFWGHHSVYTIVCPQPIYP